MIYGERIVLRAIERNDLPRYVRWLNNPAVLEYFGSLLPLGLAQEEQWYESMLQDASQRSFAIEVDGQHIGGAGFGSMDGRNRSAEVGLFIGKPELWKQGFGTDTLQTLLRFGFEQMNLHRIYLRVFADHARAIRLYEKIGFRHEGRWRQAEYRGSSYHDLLWMSILEDEWRG
jgi:RimJ/RimL family protein N-acetyltransferase